MDISVVIPTRNRPKHLLLALRSVQAQTIAPTEVIIVLDGPDDETEGAIASLDWQSIVVVVLPHPIGGSGARNAGVARARGKWIALLDDDDEWTPTKLEQQIEAAEQSGNPDVIVTSRVLARSPYGDEIWPKRLPEANEPIGDFLFIRSGWFQGEGLVQTSTLFAAKSTFTKVRFDESLAKHQDWDWILRALALESTSLSFLPEPLTIWRIDDGRQAVGSSPAPRSSLQWAEDRKELLSPQAFAWFLLLGVGEPAARTRDYRLGVHLIRRALAVSDKLPIRALILYMTWWLIPPSARRWARALAARHNNPAPLTSVLAARSRFHTSSISDNSTPSVSVIIATRGRPELLARSIKSIFDQDYAGAIECVVVHDQEAVQLLTIPSIPARSVIQLENLGTIGLSGARNFGMSVASNDIFAFCDDDDEWSPLKLRQQIPQLNLGYRFSVTGIEVVTARRSIVRLPPVELTLRELGQNRVLAASPSTFVFTKELALLVGPVDESLPGDYGEDYDWLLRAARFGPIGCIQEPLVRLHWDRPSWFADRWKLIAEATITLADRHPEIVASPRAAGRTYGKIAFAYAASGSRRQAGKWALRSAYHDPLQARAYLAALVAAGILRATWVTGLLAGLGHGI